MAQPTKRKSEGKQAKLAFRAREQQESQQQKRLSTRPEDIIKELSDGKLLARRADGQYYMTTLFYTKTDLADPNRYGRPGSLVSAEDAERLLH